MSLRSLASLVSLTSMTGPCVEGADDAICDVEAPESVDEGIRSVGRLVVVVVVVFVIVATIVVVVVLSASHDDAVSWFTVALCTRADRAPVSEQ